MAVLATGLLTTTSTAGSQSAAGTFSNGQASASSQAFKVNPTASSLSIGITLGIALAGYQNEVAKAEARGIDLGIIGTVLASEQCDGSDPSWPAEDQPQPLAVDSRDEGAAQGKSGPEVAQGVEIPLFRKSVRATPEPFGDASTVTAPIGQAGAVEVAGARSDATVKTVDKQTREAIATAEIGSLILGGGAVRLGNLRWTAVHHTGADTSKSGTFTVGSMSIGGIPVPVPSGDPAAVFAAVNPVLAPLGIELRPPVTREVNGAVVVDPLVVGVVPSPTRDQVAGTLFNSIQPVREALVDALLELDCGNATYITVADIAIGSMTGAGSFSLELGGASAVTGELVLSSLLQDPVAPALTPAQLPAQIEAVETPDIGSSLVAGTPGTPGRPGTAATTRRTAGRAGSLSSLLALVALTLLVGSAVAAELDRRKMRQAVETTSSEV